MSTLIDARQRGRDKSADNRARFLRRFRGLLRSKVADLARHRSIRDANQGAELELSPHDISEPRFRHRAGSGAQSKILPGNDRFTRGEHIPRRPQGTAEGGSDPADGSAGDDPFRFVLTRDEYLGILFDDLELPRLLRTQQADITETRIRRAGYSRQGVPGTLAVPRTMKTSLARRTALSGALREQLRLARAELAAREAEATAKSEAEAATKATARSASEASLNPTSTDALAPESERTTTLATDQPTNVAQRLRSRIVELERQLQHVPFLDELDLRYRAAVPFESPRTAAVMICLMDVSSSMDEDLKDIAKRFFLLLYLFLERKYDRVELVFIRHTEDAEECQEQEFFHGSKSGGTRVLAGLQKVAEVALRYPASHWNVYLAQASDGDAFGDDGTRSAQFLASTLRERLRFAVFLGVGSDENSTLARSYRAIADAGYLSMAHAANRDLVYPAFRALFLPTA
jgi:uncharacterized sporulation protein YeaH/YhbH (DUF444 family)